MPFDVTAFSWTPLLAQSPQITNWLTPVWLISVGVSIGFLLVLLFLLKIYVVQRIPFFNTVTENPTLRVVFGGITAALYVAVFLGFCYWRFGSDFFGPGMILPLGFAIPVSLLLGFGVWSLSGRRMIGETSGLFREGFLGWINYFCIAMLIFAVLGFGLGRFNGFGIFKPVDEPMALMESLGRLPYTGTFSTTAEIPPAEKGDVGFPVPVNFHGQELQELSFDTDKPLTLAAAPMEVNLMPGYLMEIPVREDPVIYRQRTDGQGRIPLAPVENLYVNNFSSTPATLTLRWELAPIYKEVIVIPTVALWVFGVYLMYLSLATLFPKVFAIAHSTFKTEISQPLYLLILAIGVVFMVASIYVPYNTFGEDIKMYKDSGLTLIRVLAIFLAIWAASKSVAEEIEGRTALTVLSKPVGRRQFILGKFSGISLAIALLFVILGFWFVSWVAYKPIYDYKETAKGLCEWSVCYTEAIHVIPGLFLCFLEVLVFVAISVAISTRFGILANFLICFSVYVLGHLTPLLVQSSFAAFETVVVFAQLIAIVFPVLNHYDVQAAINTNSDVPLDYLAWSVIYTGLYGTMAMLLALVLFEDRDLA